MVESFYLPPSLCSLYFPPHYIQTCYFYFTSREKARLNEIASMSADLISRLTERAEEEVRPEQAEIFAL